MSCKDNREARFLLEVAEAATGTVVASLESAQPHVSTTCQMGAVDFHRSRIQHIAVAAFGIYKIN